MKIRIDDTIKVIHPATGLTVSAKVRRIGESHGMFHMMTLDVNGQTMYAVALDHEVRNNGLHR